MTPLLSDSADQPAASQPVPNQRPRMRTAGARIALVACGALARDVGEVVRRCAWPVDVYGLAALNHLVPPRIVRDADRLLASIAPRYDRIIVVYGDCGTSGELDAVLAKYDAVRPVGAHCYEWFAQGALTAMLDEEPGTYFLTDWLVRNWEGAVRRGLGLDRYPELKDTYFRHMRRLVWFRQRPEPALNDAAAVIAAYLGVPLEVRDTGTGPLERALAPLVAAASDDRAASKAR